MRDSYERLLDQMVLMASEGKFKEEVRASMQEYDNLPGGMEKLLRCVEEFCALTARQEPEIAQFRSLICQMLIVAHREAKRERADVALALANSLFDDYPGIPQSSLLPRFSSLLNASLAHKEVAHSGNMLLVWQQATRLFQAYNELLNGLLGYLILAWRAHMGKSVNANVFKSNFGTKVDQFSQITGGEDGPFYIITRLARPKIRNAIAHETIRLDSETGKVFYREDSSSDKAESEMNVGEFMVLAGLGSHLGHSYLAAISTIAVMEAGSEQAKASLPPLLVKLYNHGS